MRIEIICPLYNAENYIKHLHESFLIQEGISDLTISYVLTKSSDSSEEILLKLNANYILINPCDFSHSLTREMMAFKSNADIIVFVTQDVIIRDRFWLKNLVKDIGRDGIAASYSRQICNNKSIESYTRSKNYPDYSFVVDSSDLESKGLRTFFFSDASGAIDLNIFKSLNGYDGKKLPISEDMYFAYKLIMNGYKIKYCSDSIVEHSHDFSFKELYKRYYDTGVFFKENSYLDKYGTNSTGLNMAIHIFKSAIKEKNILALKQFFPNMIARYLGMSRGKRNG